MATKTNSRHFVVPSSAKSTTRAPSSLGAFRDFDFFSAAREAVGVFDDAFVWSGNDLRVNLSEIFHQAEMLRPSFWSVIWGDYHSPSLFGAESKCHAQYQKALTLYLIDTSHGSWCNKQGLILKSRHQLVSSFSSLVQLDCMLCIMSIQPVFEGTCGTKHDLTRFIKKSHQKNDSVWVSATVLPCTVQSSPPVQPPGQPHCRDAFVLSFLSFPCAQGPGNWKAHGVEGSPNPKKTAQLRGRKCFHVIGTTTFWQGTWDANNFHVLWC